MEYKGITNKGLPSEYLKNYNKENTPIKKTAGKELGLRSSELSYLRLGG